jgi:diacylglycerol kinase (ATP)
MQGIVVLNPNAGTSDKLALVEDALVSHGYRIERTEGQGHARRIAEDAARNGLSVVVAAGGDGTISEIVDGLAAVGGVTRLGLLPLGTGNDLARTLAIPLELEAAVDALFRARDRRIDLIAVEPDAGARVYAVNVAAGGFSGQVDEEITTENKERWGALAYLFGAAKVLPDLTGYQTTFAWDDGGAEQIEALNVIVANGRSCAGGRLVAPLANPEDGSFDVVVVRHGTLLELAPVAARLAVGNYLESERVLFKRARAVRIHSVPGMHFNVDGELLPLASGINFRIVPGALPVIVGPDYAPEPAAPS